MNLKLAGFLARRNLVHHRTVAIVTILGVAIGMTVVSAIMIVDRNSVETSIQSDFNGPSLVPPASIAGNPQREKSQPGQSLRVTFERDEPWRSTHAAVAGFPTQEGKAAVGIRPGATFPPRGEEDYQAMRLAVRLASLMAFAIGAVIVFYTMRFSVASRSREFSLLLCLGEGRGNAVLSLLFEAAALGLLGTLAGLVLAFPASKMLIDLGISTTGRVPAGGFLIPWLELGILATLSAGISMLGAVGPARALYRLHVVDVLQPRFMAAEHDAANLDIRGFAWLIPPLAGTGYLAVRPFLEDWLTVVEFFVLEVLFVWIFAIATLWWTKPLLRGAIRIAEITLRPFLLLESVLVGRRLRLSSRKTMFTVVGVALVFSLLTALHDITAALKHEINTWAQEALYPYVFFEGRALQTPADLTLDQAVERDNLYIFRLSAKASGEFPARLIAADDVNPFLRARNQPTLGPGRVMVSRTLASRFKLTTGDRVIVHIDQEVHRFEVIAVTDAVGFFADNGQYVDLKSYFLFSEGNPLFAGNLERSLGDYGVARRRDGRIPRFADIASIRPYYDGVKQGRRLSAWQKLEIDRDFLIFDFILFMTVVLAAVGVSNAILIEVHARRRELSVLRTVGISRGQTTRLLLVEGAIIGMVGAMLAMVLGHAVGAISVTFLDRFTLFNYEFVLSAATTLLIALAAIVTTCLAAIYPAVVANRVSSAESLHYE